MYSGSFFLTPGVDTHSQRHTQTHTVLLLETDAHGYYCRQKTDSETRIINIDRHADTLITILPIDRTELSIAYH